MKKNDVVNKKDVEASEDDRVKKICAVVDQKIIDFNMDYIKVEKWIMSNAKTVEDAYHAGFYLAQAITQTRGYNWVDAMVFGQIAAPPIEEETEEDEPFGPGPQEPSVQVVEPVKEDTQKTKDAIDDFLDKQKPKTPGKNQAGPEVA